MDRIPERLRTAAEGVAKATQMIAEAKSKRNGDGACYSGLKKEQTAEWYAAEILDRLHAAHERAKANLKTLEDMKAANNLTQDWGECSLISARRFVEELGIVVGSHG